MSVFHLTSYVSLFQREISLIVAFPEYQDEEVRPFDGCVLLPPATREVDWFLRTTPLEDDFCRKQGKAAVCLPGWIQTHPAFTTYMKGLPAYIAQIFPVRIKEEQLLPFLISPKDGSCNTTGSR